MKLINKIINKKIFYGLISLLFIYINYSSSVWSFFNDIGGLVGAKIIPEIIGIVFFLILSKIYIKNFYPQLKLCIRKKDYLAISFFIFIGFIYRYREFNNYFWRDDFYLVLNRLGTEYSLYQWGNWLSSFSLWLWELIRLIFGYSIFPYQIIAIFSHILLAIGVYILSKYLSKKYYIGIITSFLVLTTTITFEAFQWLIHPISFGWQGFFVCLSVIACVWEITETKNKGVPYLSAFLMIPAFAGGISRIGFVLPLLSGVCFLTSVKYLKIKKWTRWVLNLLSKLWIYYFMVLTFFSIRSLWGASVRTEMVDASFYKIYMSLIGTFVFPVELFRVISNLFNSYFSVGKLTIIMGSCFLIFFFLLFLFTKIKKKKFPLILSISFIWLLISTLYYALFAPHVPVSNLEIDTVNKSHHLSYLASVGSLMIWGYLFFQILLFFWKIKNWIGKFIVVLLITFVVISSYVMLSKQYDSFLDFPKGVNITRQQFFFNTYLKYISLNARKVNIFYDDGASKRKDNYKPGISYYWSFWDINNVKIFYGDKELKDYLATIADLKTKDDEINNLYYIYTDYDDGLIEENLSPILRNNVNIPILQKIPIENWKNYWGRKYGNTFYPEIFVDKENNLNYFNNPTIFVDQMDLPSVLTPKLTIKLYVQELKQSIKYVDLRARVFSQILNDWSLPTNDQALSLVRSETNNTVSNTAFNNLLSSVHINDKMVCGEKTDDNGIAFIVVWFGEPNSYNSMNINKDFLSGYLDKYYSICYFSDIYGIKEISLDLSYLGSILRKVVIVPLTTNPVTINVLESSLESPRILK